MHPLLLAAVAIKDDLTPWDLVWAFWLGLFGVFELLAVGRLAGVSWLQWVRWQPLSDMTWSIESAWRPFAVLIVLGFLWLIVHLVFPKIAP